MGASASLTLPFLAGGFGSCSDKEPGPEIQYDGIIGIIGAGAAGLYAADILTNKGVKVKVFEASDRVGGRIRSIRLFDDSSVKTDFPIELGAERIIGTDSLWARIIGQLTIPTKDLAPSATNQFILDGKIKDLAAVQNDADFVAAQNFLAALSLASGDITVQQAIEAAGINSRVHAILNSWIGNYYGTSNERLGVQGLADSLNLLARNKNELLLRSNPMQDVLASRFSGVLPDVELNTVVKSIDFSSGKVVLTGQKTNGGAVENFAVDVNKVIVTVPISILKAGAIVFTPALPKTKTTALSRIDMGACVRIVLDFKKNFWGNETGFIYGGTQGPEYLSSGYARSELNKILSVTIHGAKAEELSGLGEQAIDKVLEELDNLYEGQASLNIRTDENQNKIFEFFDWTKHPYIKGSASYLRPGAGNQDRVALAEPMEQLVFFAGEATDTEGEAGTINGALLSAQRAVVEVVNAILA